MGQELQHVFHAQPITTDARTAATFACLNRDTGQKRAHCQIYCQRICLVILTAGYALFQTANTTAVMSGVAADRRGVMAGLLNVSRNLGLITGASVMGAVFALASATSDITTARPEAIAAGMRITFAVAAILIAAALAIVFAGRSRQR